MDQILKQSEQRIITLPKVNARVIFVPINRKS